MIDRNLEQELCGYLRQMPEEHQRRVLEFARTLAGPSVKGVPGSTLLRFAGSIDASDLEMMSQAVEDGCERIEDDEW